MNDEVRWYLLQRKVREKNAVAFSESLKDEGIVPVLLKGLAIERYYPMLAPRPATDIDFAVDPKHFKTAQKIRNSTEFAGFGFDIHSGLRHLDNRQWEHVFKRTVTLGIAGKELRVLCEEDLLRVAAIHWLTDGGERKDRLLDIVYLVQNRSHDFDWEYCLAATGIKRRRWVELTLLLANMYFDLELEGLPIETKQLEVPKWLVASVETRWNDPVKFAPLDTYLSDPYGFLKQLRRRFPPNPIMSTIALEGDFNEASRTGYQIRYFFKRLVPSFLRVSGALAGKR